MTALPALPSRPFAVELDVRFPEVDSYGVVWHGHYILYCEVARNALCAAGGLTPAEALAAGYKVPITRFEMNLRRSARLDDRLAVEVTLRPPETAKLVMDYAIRRVHAKRELLGTGTTEQVILNPGGELLLTFPAAVKTLVEKVLAYQRGEQELNPADKILVKG
ncbi:MAG: thioesterase family protein [Thermoanaerobaculia bacterium]